LDGGDSCGKYCGYGAEMMGRYRGGGERGDSGCERSDCAWVIQFGAGGSKIKKRKSTVYLVDQVPPM
jgi:hypothetical protein